MLSELQLQHVLCGVIAAARGNPRAETQRPTPFMVHCRLSYRYRRAYGLAQRSASSQGSSENELRLSVRTSISFLMQLFCEWQNKNPRTEMQRSTIQSIRH